MTPDPILDEVKQDDTIETTHMQELVRKQAGLVNLIQPPKPQAPKQKQRVIRQGGSAARKILKGQR